ncbi:unnamed protein product [Caenorhabditis bovis]|uniref:ZP domain-containing protein n=1 Tax=Caenorhabditis bovis TaxID=2654633 RepID=A0A8S1EZB6_9PELO|nr:unnamed protein product [Caenorhabditis bovis]
MLNIVILLLAISPNIIAIIEYDNSIQGQPEIACTNSGATLKVETVKGAPSHVFIKGHFRKEGCSFSNTSLASFEFSQCDVARKREVNPKGIAYSMTVVVQLHPLFTTRVDRAYSVHCFYQETEKVVGAEVSVSDPTPTLMSIESEQPTCTYTIHKGSPNGPLAKFAQLGDVIYHVWECPSKTYEMFVHDCSVVDVENSNNKKVIDEKGCSEDVFIMPNIVYNDNRTKAFVSSNAFNFPDQMSVRFNCQIQICPSISTSCYQPNCNGEASSVDETTSEPIDGILARDELITTPLPPVTATVEETTTTSTTTTSTTTTATTTASTTAHRVLESSTTVTLPTGFPTPDNLFMLLKKIKNATSELELDVEGSGLEIATTDEPRTTKREIRRRDAIDVDISSPDLMIIDRDFVNELPAPLEQFAEAKGLEANSKSICLPFFIVWILVGLVIFALSITFTALCYSIKQRPSSKQKKGVSTSMKSKPGATKSRMANVGAKPAMSKSTPEPAKEAKPAKSDEKVDKPQPVEKKKEKNDENENNKDGSKKDANDKEQGKDTLANEDLMISQKSVKLYAKDLPKLDSTVMENVTTPAVHERAQKIAADKLIIDPKHTSYGGNIDAENEKQAKLSKFADDLKKKQEDEMKDVTSKRILKNNMRVKVKEEKCILYETNEIPTDDDEEEANNDAG